MVSQLLLVPSIERAVARESSLIINSFLALSLLAGFIALPILDNFVCLIAIEFRVARAGRFFLLLFS